MRCAAFLVVLVGYTPLHARADDEPQSRRRRGTAQARCPMRHGDEVEDGGCRGAFKHVTSLNYCALLFSNR